mgnify:CR=1 FL=1
MKFLDKLTSHKTQKNTALIYSREKTSVAVRLEHVSKIYEDPKTHRHFYAVKDSNIVIQPGEFVTLLGPSGCGKTTTLRMIAGLEEITSGEIYIDDKLVNTLPPKDRDIAMVFQNYALYPHMTVYDNMAFGLKMRHVKKNIIDEKIHEAAKLLEIEEYLDRKPKELSGGQMQRVALGRAIVRNPKVFLLDEPLSNLDAKLRVQMRIEIQKIHQRLETTIIYVTHDQTEAMTLGTRIVVLKDGIIQQVDTPQNLYDKPCNVFVAGFMGSPQMNLINAKVVQSGEDVVLMFGGNTIKLPEGKAQKLIEAGYVDTTVIMGIRPEDLNDSEVIINANPDCVIEATIRVYELLGAEVFLYFDIDEVNCTARVNPRTTARPGDTIKLGIDMTKLHIFDKDTEQVILH